MESGQDKYGLVGDIGNIALLPADLAIDGLVNCLQLVFGDVPAGSMTSRVLDIHVDRAKAHLFEEFTVHFADREQKFLANFHNSYLSNANVEDGRQEMDMDGFMIEQKKVMWDVLKKTYFAKYRFRAEERIKDDAFYISEWSGIDFAVLPPFLAGYVYYRGLDKTIKIDHDLTFKIQLEPGMQFMGGDVVGGIMVELRYKPFPIGIIASMGIYDRKPEFEFIGIGSSIDAVKKCIKLSGKP